MFPLGWVVGWLLTIRAFGSGPFPFQTYIFDPVYEVKTYVPSIRIVGTKSRVLHGLRQHHPLKL